MDRALGKVCDSICIAGPHGLSMHQFIDELKRAFRLETVSEANWAYFLSLFKQLEPDFAFGKISSGDPILKGNRSRLFSWSPVAIVDNVSMADNEARVFCTNQELRNSVLLDGRILPLPENSLLILQLIGSYGRDGVTQSDLARVLGCDSKSVFHWLKPLMVNDLIIRTPVSVAKTFTYQIVLSRFEEDDLYETETGLTMNYSSVEIRQLIIDILSKAPSQRLTSGEVFAATGLHRSQLKAFRRAVLQLSEKGWIEISIEHQLLRQNLRVLRLLCQGDYKRSDIKARQECVPETPSVACEYDPNVPIVNQFIKLLAIAYPEGLSADDICIRLGVSKKYFYRLVDHMFTFQNEGLVKISDFVGKEKRLKFFIKNAEWQKRYFDLFNAPTMASSSQLPSQISSLLSSRPSSPLLSSASSTSTLARHIRHEVLLSELQEQKVLTIGKALALLVQERTGDSKHTLDVKTLRRSADILAAEGKLNQVNVSVPSGSKTLLLLPGLTVNSPEVLEYIAALRDGTVTARAAPKLPKPSPLQQARLDDPDFFEPVAGSVEVSEGEDSAAALAARNRAALEKFGFIQGIMARAAILHQHLLQSHSRDIKTMALDETLTFGEFLQIIGVVNMSREMYARQAGLLAIPLSDLDANAKEELSWSRKRFLSQLAVLLETLSQLNLITRLFDDELSKIPEQIVLNDQVSLFGNRYTFPEDYDRYWAALKATSQTDVQYVSSIYDDSLSRSLLLARHPDSWKRGFKRDRDLIRAVRKLAAKIAANERSKRRRMYSTNPIESISAAEEIARLAVEYEDSEQRIEHLLASAVSDFNRPRLEQRSDQSGEPVGPLEDMMDIQQEPESKQNNVLNLTAEEHLKLEMAFALLQSPRFASRDGTIKWQLATSVLPIDPNIIRRHGLKICRSYDDLLRLLEYDTIVQVVLCGADPDLDYKSAFALCWSAIDQENLLSGLSGGLELLPDRMSYYWAMFSDWFIPRSFRHDYYRNQSGLAKVHHQFEPPKALSQLALALRRVLVWTHSAAADFDAAAAFKFLEHFGGTDDAALNGAIEELLNCGFAVKNRPKSRFKLLGFPISVSEPGRSLFIVAAAGDDVVAAALFDEFGREDERRKKLSETLTTLTPNTNNPLIHRFGHEAIAELLEMDLEVTDLGRVSVRPRQAGHHNDGGGLDLSTFAGAQSAIWMNCDGRLNETIVRRCLRAVERVISASPGICKPKIYEALNLMTTDEIDHCLGFLSRCGRIKCHNGCNYE